MLKAWASCCKQTHPMLGIWSLCFLWIVWVSNSSTDWALHVSEHAHAHSQVIVYLLVLQIRLKAAQTQAMTCGELFSLSLCGIHWPCHWEQGIWAAESYHVYLPDNKVSTWATPYRHKASGGKQLSTFISITTPTSSTESIHKIICVF